MFNIPAGGTPYLVGPVCLLDLQRRQSAIHPELEIAFMPQALHVSITFARMDVEDQVQWFVSMLALH